ncbi:hypothetical protein EOT10_39500 [Streptomyces antnestii]|uniref:Uncharacterized protein n=1 Tax=Streptomyces antnestii TaxID=2494256 RepID=A0A3S2V6V2_9ACTN|nr:hypothetical protein [Streptomyces sp. San01]RVU15255.1 hypothetical protein EOT10_39500 [Streptomyces sp. San01]
MTPYALAFAEQPARSYLLRRSAELAWGAGRVARALAQAAPSGHAEVQLQLAHDSLARASVVGRAAGADENPALAAYPLALPLAEHPALPTDRLHTIPDHLADDCERLSRAAFEALHGRGEQQLSGSDLQQLARWRALGNLLSGRALLYVADQAPTPAAADELREAATKLRTAARTWQEAASGWHRVVDVADPRAHPTLPPPGYALVRSGRFAAMPATAPHPALGVAHAATTRMGQLLYGAEWQPSTPGRPEARPAADVLADAGGLARLTETVYRMSATGWQLAAASPVALRRIGARLVTNTVEHRPADAAYRFYPLPGHRAERLAESYKPVLNAERTAASALLRTARHTGMDLRRATLDAAAHQSIAAQRLDTTRFPPRCAAQERDGWNADRAPIARSGAVGQPTTRATAGPAPASSDAPLTREGPWRPGMRESGSSRATRATRATKR